jgi:hypothetical protein
MRNVLPLYLPTDDAILMPLHSFFYFRYKPSFLAIFRAPWLLQLLFLSRKKVEGNTSPLLSVNDMPPRKGFVVYFPRWVSFRTPQRGRNQKNIVVKRIKKGLRKIALRKWRFLAIEIKSKSHPMRNVLPLHLSTDDAILMPLHSFFYFR